MSGEMVVENAVGWVAVPLGLVGVVCLPTCTMCLHQVSEHEEGGGVFKPWLVHPNCFSAVDLDSDRTSSN